MFDSQRWAQLVTGDDCPLCRELAVPEPAEPRLIGVLPSGRVLLQNDAAFRGYCILPFVRHATELPELSSAEQSSLINDVGRIARAILAVCPPAKLNYAILGNEVPHLHVHIIPRYPDDGWWGRAVWLRPADQKRTLPPDEFAALKARLAAVL